ncbi:hypothetical protein E1B28_002773 [Marasmius oreades]|uniref:Uncharacterized protein n=1 Tax=Marasmius oreades TaxID=181124 RepID=A0A9P7UL77_9AGAR|nr:uncharacterized protein E1B28_002773 [Marasmius oreades]KAG7086852.1 hypothetical protein E1B28_002773 [Marasmius oreades]
MTKLTIQIPSTTYTHHHTSSVNLNPLPISGSAQEASTSTTRSTTYPYSHQPPSPCGTDTDSDSMLSLEVADAPPSPSPRYVGRLGYQSGHEGHNLRVPKPLAPTYTWEYGSGSSPTHPASSSNSWIPRANYELSSDPLLSTHQFQGDGGRMQLNANLPLPNPHPPSTSLPNALANLNNPLPYPRTPSASSSTSSKSVSSASTNSNSSYVTSASSTGAADYLRPPPSPNDFKARMPSPLGERGKTPSPLSSNAALSALSGPRLAHRTSSPSPLSASFSLGIDVPRPGTPSQPHREDSGSPFASNRAASPLKRPTPRSSSFLLNNASDSKGDSTAFQPECSPYHTLQMARSESPAPMDDTPKASGKVRLVGNAHHDESSSLRLPFHTQCFPVPAPQPVPLQQLIPQSPTRSHTPRSFSRSEHDLSRVPPRPHSRAGTRLPVPPTLMPAHHRNSSCTSLVSSMGGFTGGVSGGMAGNRPLSGFIGDLTFGGPSPTSPTFPPQSFAAGGNGHRRTGSGSGSFMSGHKRISSHDNNGLGIEYQRNGSSIHSCGGYTPSVATGREQKRSPSGSFGHGYRRRGSNGSWVAASFFEGGATFSAPPPPSRRHGHTRSHSYDHVPLSQPQEEEDETIFTGFGGVGRPTPSPSPSPATPSFPQSRPLPIPISRHPSRSSSSFGIPQRPYSAMGYAPSFTHSEVYLRSQSTGELSMAAMDPNMFIGSQSTGTASWIGSQPTGTATFSLAPSIVDDQGESTDAKPAITSRPSSGNARNKLTKSRSGGSGGSPSKSYGRGASPIKSGYFKLFGKKKGKGIVNGDGVFVAGIAAGVKEGKTEEKQSASPLKKLGLSFKSLSPKKQQTKEQKPEGLIWSSAS